MTEALVNQAMYEEYVEMKTKMPSYPDTDSKYPIDWKMPSYDGDVRVEIPSYTRNVPSSSDSSQRPANLPRGDLLGSKEENFFESQAWLDSDGDNDFMSVNVDTPSYRDTDSKNLVELKAKMPSYDAEVSIKIPSYTTRNVPSASDSSQGPVNLPRGDLLGNREEYLRISVPLYEASVKGDWEKASVILSGGGEAMLGFSITENYETALHIAASAKSTELVENYVKELVSRMRHEDLLLQNRSGNTALCLAAAGGNITIAWTLVDKNTDLVNIRGSQGFMPLHIASLYGKYEMVNFLYDISNEMEGPFWTHQDRSWVLLQCVEADFFDVALKIVTDSPELAINGGVLRVLARKTDAFRNIKSHIIRRAIGQIFAAIKVKIEPVEKESPAMELLRVIWTTIVRRSKAEVDEILRGPADEVVAQDERSKTKYSSQVLFIAASMGNTKFVVELIRQYPDLIWKLNDNNQSIFHVAVSHRQEDIYNLLYEIGTMKDFVTPLVDQDGNNMLHLVGKISQEKRLQAISGVALQMQRELLWFKEVEGIIPPYHREKKNKKGLLPHELFTIKHKELVSASEKWMKDTASQCMVVAALIATIVFAAAFTVPGGYNQDTGIPMLRRKKAFIVFVISDAISLTFSTISILMFLYILTSRYAEQDFLESLPKKLMRGLASLFLSITSMMVAFSVSFFVLYDNELIWVPVVIGVLALIPVVLYARLQYELLADVYHSTYGSTKLFKPEKPMLYSDI